MKHLVLAGLLIAPSLALASTQTPGKIDAVTGFNTDGQRMFGWRHGRGHIENVSSRGDFAGHALEPRALDFHLGLRHGFVAGETIDIHHQFPAFEQRDHLELLGRGGGTRFDRLCDGGRRCAVILPTVAERQVHRGQGHGK